MNAILKFIFTILFFVIITPVGLIMRLFGADLLQKKIETGKKSYWTKHNASH